MRLFKRKTDNITSADAAKTDAADENIQKNDGSSSSGVIKDLSDRVSTGSRRMKQTVSEKASEYASDTRENRYRYVLTGITTIIIAASLIAGIAAGVASLLDQRIIKPGKLDLGGEHTPIFIDKESEAIYYESGLFAPAVVEDFVSLKVGDIIYSGPVANLIKNNCPVFETAEEIDGEFLLSFGVWEVLAEDFYSAGVTSIDDITYISYEVIDAAIKEYFEIDEPPFHIDSITRFGEFTADNKKQAYMAPSTGYEEQIMPRVSAVESKKATTLASDGVTEQITTYVTLTLDCILSTDLENYELENGAYPVAERQVELSIRVDPDGSYKFTSLRIAGQQTEQTGGEQQ